MARRCSTALALVLLAPGARAGEVPGAVIALEVLGPPAPGHVPSASPPRFVLLESGELFVGGTSRLASGRLDKAQVQALLKRVEQVRKLPGLGSTVSFGGEWPRSRLTLRKGRALEIVASGDPAAAPANLEPLASLLRELSAFTHPSLRPHQPASFALRASEGSLPGGCRTWTFDVSPSEVTVSPRTVAAAAAADWPTGGTAAFVCVGAKSYIVTLRPLLPGERPTLPP
jgi:hypothetical protein